MIDRSMHEELKKTFVAANSQARSNYYPYSIDRSRLFAFDPDVPRWDCFNGVMVSPGSAIIRLIAGFWGELGDL